MSFVGIICAPRQEKYIKQTLQLNLNNKNIIVLKEDNIDNFKNITFETIAIFSNQTNTFQKRETILKIISKSKYLIINADEPISTELIKILKGNIITYGFNTKSTVTASSVKEDNILICIQRSFINCLKKAVEPQEILVPITLNKTNTITIMGIVSILIVYGKEQF